MEKSKGTNKLKEKLTYKYRFVVLNEDTFEERFSFKLNRLNAFIFGSLFSIFLIALTTLIITFTPLKEYIQGYSSTELKKDATNLVYTVDSLKSVLSINRNGLANLKNPRFNCPSCQTKILFKPSRGQCGSCLHIFAFYDFMFPK